MSDAPRRFDQAEFERILRRAVDLHSEDGDRHFDTADVLSAGHDLGIPDRYTQAAAREVLGPDAMPHVERPASATTRIERTEQGLVLTAPPLGLSGRSAREVFVGTIWLGALIVWAGEVARSSLGLALLALPFVLLALARLGPVARAAFERVELRLTERSGELLRTFGPIRWRQALDPTHLVVRLARESDGALDPHHHLLLEDRHTRAAILRRRQAAELIWIDAELHAWLAAAKKTSSKT